MLGFLERTSQTSTTFDLRRRESVDLRGFSLFTGLDMDELELIRSRCTVRQLPRGAGIVTAGENAEAMFAIQSGRVKFYLSSDEGKELVLRTLSASETFAETAVLEDASISANVVTLEATRLLVIPREVLRELASHNAHFAMQLAERFALETRMLSEQVRCLGLLNVYQRLVRTLYAMAQPQQDYLVVRERCTHQELAKRIGASREMVTRIFRDLIVGGYLRVEAKRVIIAKKLPASW